MDASQAVVEELKLLLESCKRNSKLFVTFRHLGVDTSSTAASAPSLRSIDSQQYEEEMAERRAIVLQCLALFDRMTATLSDLHWRADHSVVSGISMQTQGILQVALELVVAWGVQPALMPGVGIPLSHRSRSGVWVSGGEFAMQGSTLHVQQSLWTCVQPVCSLLNAMLPITASATSSEYLPKDVELLRLRNILLPRFLVDILASLFQLGFCPEGTDPALQSDRTDAFQVLTGLLTTHEEPACIAPALIIESLTMLLSGSAPHAPASVTSSTSTQQLPRAPPPAWLRSVCSHFLSLTLLRSGAVRSMLQSMADSGTLLDERAVQHVLRVVSTFPPALDSVVIGQFPNPQRVSRTMFYQAVLRQVHSLLQSSVHASSAAAAADVAVASTTSDALRILQRVAARATVALYGKAAALTTALVIRPLLAPLWAMAHGASNQPTRCCWSSAELHRSIHVLRVLYEQGTRGAAV